MQDANWEHDCACNQETPQTVCKASKDVREPREKQRQSNEPAHDYAFFSSDCGTQPYCRQVRWTSVSAAGRQTY